MMSHCTKVNDWQSVCLSFNEPFSKALEVLGGGGYQLALIIDEDNKLYAIVTDSDARKAILRNISLDDSVRLVANTHPVVGNINHTQEEANSLMLMHQIFHLPLVDKEGIIEGLYIVPQLLRKEDREELFIIMAGGRGRRLMPLTSELPKPMLKIGEKPLLQIIIEHAKAGGFKHFAISVNYLSHVIIDYFGDGSAFGIDICYLEEKEPLGTAGCLSMLPAGHQGKSMLVTNGDILTDINYGEIINYAQEAYADGVMCVRSHQIQNPYGVVVYEGKQLTGITEKPVYKSYVNAGIYFLKSGLVGLMEKGACCDMTDLFLRGLDYGLDLQIFPLHESWIDIGRPEDYQQALIRNIAKSSYER